jgi:hypothetical protein
MFTQTRFFLLGCTLLAPFTAKPATITVNAVCEVNCSAPDSLTNGTSVSGPFDFTFAFADGDNYEISGNYAASYSTADGSAIGVDPSVAYLGAEPTAGADTIDFTLFQSYFDTSCCSWAGTYSESVPLSLSALAGPGSTVAGELFYDGQGVGLAGPYGPGNYLVNESASLDFGASDSNPELTADFSFAFQFAAGTLPGAISSSIPPTPEPALSIPCGLGLILLGSVRRWRNRSRTSR